MGDVLRPSGVVSFLFTDIEGSTRRWEDDAGGMRDALAAHDDVLRSAIETNGGWLFKHTGDGVCAAFESPGNAVEAAVTAQRALDLPVRMGIATGAAEPSDDDYFGPALNRAARVMDAGHGGQVLVASVAAALVSDVDLLDLGPRRLRDLSEPVGLFQVRAPGLRLDFPPLKTLDTTPGNLRPQLTSFVGREAELAEVAEALGAHRLVTLTGVGGVGKTRLALQAAALLAPDFPEGVWVVELAEVGDPAAVPDAVASELGILQQPGSTVAQSIAATLADRFRLLVLDNCEHVLDAAADLVEEILAASTTVKILATTREALRVGDEQVLAVPSLDVRAGSDSECVALFVERAETIAADFSMDRPADAEAVLEICRRLDGVPLAIELAASRMASMSPTEVRDRLDNRFRLLSGARRGLERHQTLRHAVQWSYDLLTDDERELLNSCSVFAGGFSLDAAMAVGGSGQDEYAVLDLLDALVHKSLLAADRSAVPTRYAMLETIRQFAEDQLADTGRSATVRNAHAHFYASRMCEADELWDGPRQREVYDWFNSELANLRTAFRFAADEDDLDSAATIAGHGAWLGYFLEEFEPSIWADEIVEAAREAEHTQLVSLFAAASLAHTRADPEAAERYADAAMALIEDDYDAHPLGEGGRLALVAAYASVGRADWSLRLSRQAYERQSSAGPAAAFADLILGLVLSGRLEEARAEASGLLELADQTENPRTAGSALFGYCLAMRASDPGAALAAVRRGLAIARESGNRQQLTYLAFFAAMLELPGGQSAEGLDHLTDSINAYLDVGATDVVDA